MSERDKAERDKEKAPDWGYLISEAKRLAKQRKLFHPRTLRLFPETIVLAALELAGTKEPTPELVLERAQLLAKQAASRIRRG